VRGGGGAGWVAGIVVRFFDCPLFRLPALLALDRRIDKSLWAAHRAQKDAMAKKDSKVLVKLIGNLRYQTVLE
jgi:hypothetical protein